MRVNPTAYISIAAAASLIGVTPKSIRDRIAGVGAWPKLPVKMVAGKRCVVPMAAYEHFLAHGNRQPDGLRKPAGIATADAAIELDAAEAVSAALIDPEIKRLLGAVDPLTMDMMELAKRLALSGSIAPATIRLVTQLAALSQRIMDAEQAAIVLIPPAMVRKMIQAHAELIRDQADKRADHFADALLRFIASTFQIDLTQKNPNAALILSGYYREDMNRLFKCLDDIIKEQAQQIRELEIKGGTIIK